MLYYKFLNEKKGKIVSEHGKHVWEIGKEYSVTGRVVKCENGFHASKQPLDALGYVKGNILAVVKVSGDHDDDNDKVCYRNMTIVKAYKWTQADSVALAIYAAEQVIKIYEKQYPKDMRPREAINAAKAYLKDPSKKNKDAACAAARAAYAAACAAARAAARAAYAAAYAAADAAARAAARAAYAAAYAAADAAARAAYAAARAAARAAYAAADAAADAAAYAAMKLKINRFIKSRIKKLEAIK